MRNVYVHRELFKLFIWILFPAVADENYELLKEVRELNHDRQAVNVFSFNF